MSNERTNNPTILYDEDLFQSGSDVIVNPVNCVGAMGAGLALEFRKRYPDMFNDYLIRCRRHEVKLGEPYLYRDVKGIGILNFPTKGHWKDNSQLEDIYNGVTYLVQNYKEMGIKSIAVPALGCGKGQLDWADVHPI